MEMVMWTMQWQQQQNGYFPSKSLWTKLVSRKYILGEDIWGRKPPPVWEQQPFVPQGLLLAMLQCLSCGLPEQLLTAAATSCIQGDPEKKGSSAAMQTAPWRHEAIVGLHAIKCQGEQVLNEGKNNLFWFISPILLSLLDLSLLLWLFLSAVFLMVVYFSWYVGRKDKRMKLLELMHVDP